MKKRLILIVLIIFTCKGISSAAVSEKKGKRMALLVGIGGYQDKNWATLKFPEKDVEKLKAVLESPDLGHFDSVKTLIGKDASRSNILMELEKLRRENTSTTDLILIYFSNHGSTDYNEKNNLSQYLIAYDSQFNLISSTGI